LELGASGGEEEEEDAGEVVGVAVVDEVAKSL
jgi:hypothetical protein